MANVDLTKQYRDHYRAADEPGIVEVPERPYLMVDGAGDPNTSQSYQDAISTLYPLAYGLRKAIKDATGNAYKVMPLEGLWWVDDGSAFDFDNRSNWRWTAMICQPDEVTRELAKEIIPAVNQAKKLVLGHEVRWELFGDGVAVQVLHRGPYSAEAPTIARLHEYIKANGYSIRGKHHEIYLTDPRKGDPANNRTIIRQPVDR